ncbi:hypothetical protein C4900_05475 [Acidiferrobacter thiooxydans]|jgi:hypothetical protein|uniref:Uncharacterized protein n=1 Tax=Acidiferrobacter thiooxydans TaxID=163359 RepID=A0A1C2FYZ4_9GAMM|nr:hypothetical protein C4900_05475 [Acidiferrobacter thiooxydans]
MAKIDAAASRRRLGGGLSVIRKKDKREGRALLPGARRDRQVTDYAVREFCIAACQVFRYRNQIANKA